MYVTEHHMQDPRATLSNTREFSKQAISGSDLHIQARWDFSYSYQVSSPPNTYHLPVWRATLHEVVGEAGKRVIIEYRKLQPISYIISGSRRISRGTRKLVRTPKVNQKTNSIHHEPYVLSNYTTKSYHMLPGYTQATIDDHRRFNRSSSWEIIESKNKYWYPGHKRMFTWVNTWSPRHFKLPTCLVQYSGP